MARLTALQMAHKLQAQGYKVTVIMRKEGGARISSINGKHFIGSAGNVEARNILGASLSEAQKKHLEKIRQRKGVFGKKKKAPLPDDLIKLQNKINREFKKQGKSARVTRAKIRYRAEHFGEGKAREYLSRVLKYVKGYAYKESLEAYVQRLEMDKGLLEGSDIQLVQGVIDKVNKIINMVLNIKETDFQELLSLTYEWEISISTGTQLITTKGFRNSAIKILNRAE